MYESTTILVFPPIIQSDDHFKNRSVGQTISCYNNLVAELTRLPIHLNTVMQELLEVGAVKDPIVCRL